MSDGGSLSIGLRRQQSNVWRAQLHEAQKSFAKIIKRTQTGTRVTCPCSQALAEIL